MTREELAPGLQVDWLNAWLAAIGLCVLAPQVRLCWTDEPVPRALFVLPGQATLAEVTAASLPTQSHLANLVIAKEIEGRAELSRTVSLSAYKDRAALARETRDTTLSATVTDLLGETTEEGGLPHSPFDPPVPRGVTLWERVRSCRKEITDPLADVAATFAGNGRRVPVNGLGFDARRLVPGEQEVEKRVDPVVELLAFFALSLFPMRGNGREASARGWEGPPTKTGSFRWCAWRPSLDRHAIDALLDLLPQARVDRRLARRLGLTAWYYTVPYQTSKADRTRAYAARRELG
jgi:hypothetical protein